MQGKFCKYFFLKKQNFQNIPRFIAVYCICIIVMKMLVC